MLQCGALACGIVAGLTVPAAAGFSLFSHQFGEEGGQPYRTSTGTGFFVSRLADAGDGSPWVIRPILFSSAGTEYEYTTYITHDPRGPSRRSGGTNNQSDQFYIARGVYPQNFSNRNANQVSLGGPIAFFDDAGAQARFDVVTRGIITGRSFIAGPAVGSLRSPEGEGLTGLMLGRFTIPQDTTLIGRPQIVLNVGGTARTIELDVNGLPVAVEGVTNGYLRLAAYPVNNLFFFEPTFGQPFGQNYGLATTYDVWITEIPAPGSMCAVLAIGLATIQRRRAL